VALQSQLLTKQGRPAQHAPTAPPQLQPQQLLLAHQHSLHLQEAWQQMKKTKVKRWINCWTKAPDD
jgi:hypothetical protein